MRVLRSLLFYAVFYGATAGFVIASLIASVTLSGPRFRAIPNAWSRCHRWCVVNILGIAVRQEGDAPWVVEPLRNDLGPDRATLAIERPWPCAERRERGRGGSARGASRGLGMEGCAGRKRKCHSSAD